MLYKLAHIILIKFPWVWECIEWLNTVLFKARYRKYLPHVTELATIKDSKALVAFFERQPQDTFTYFRPHPFDERHITKLLKRPSMLMHVMYEGGQITGYCFLRCFFIGKGYRGYIVDSNQRKKGVGKALGLWLNQTAQTLHIRTFKTINANNEASLHLAKATCLLNKIQDMQNGDAEYECLIDTNNEKN